MAAGPDPGALDGSGIWTNMSSRCPLSQETSYFLNFWPSSKNAFKILFLSKKKKKMKNKKKKIEVVYETSSTTLRQPEKD